MDSDKLSQPVAINLRPSVSTGKAWPHASLHLLLGIVILCNKLTNLDRCIYLAFPLICLNKQFYIQDADYQLHVLKHGSYLGALGGFLNEIENEMWSHQYAQRFKIKYSLTFAILYIVLKFAPDCSIRLASDHWKQWVPHPIFYSPIGQSGANYVVGMNHYNIGGGSREGGQRGAVVFCILIVFLIMYSTVIVIYCNQWEGEIVQLLFNHLVHSIALHTIQTHTNTTTFEERIGPLPTLRHWLAKKLEWNGRGSGVDRSLHYDLFNWLLIILEIRTIVLISLQGTK